MDVGGGGAGEPTDGEGICGEFAFDAGVDFGEEEGIAEGGEEGGEKEDEEEEGGEGVAEDFEPAVFFGRGFGGRGGGLIGGGRRCGGHVWCSGVERAKAHDQHKTLIEIWYAIGVFGAIFVLEKGAGENELSWKVLGVIIGIVAG